jgi:serine/threonine-protein kinase
MTTTDKTLQEFSALWETLALDETARLDADVTQTVRPRARTQEASAEAALARLPVLTAVAGAELGGPARPWRQTLPEIEVGSLIGQGGMGQVSQAHQLSVARDVAVKSLREDSRDQEHTLVLLREGWVTGRLEHPNIVPVYTLGRDDNGEPLIVMKKIAGVSFADLLEDPTASPRELGTKQPLDFYLETLVQVCNAVHFAHSKGIIHRDIKPENVMVGEFGEVYLLDWGIAVSLDDADDGRLPLAADVTSPAGTPAYMAPEMVAGDGAELSAQTDVFLLGAVLHEILTGEPPNTGETLFQIMFDAYNAAPGDYGDDVHPELAEICQKAMHPEPERRFESAEALRQALVRHLSHRDSLRLSDMATERLETLHELLSPDHPKEPGSEHELYKIFGECRFGFEQALEVSPDNQAARQGLQRALEMLAGREIEREAYQAAALLIADLREPNRELERRLDELAQRLASRDREFEDLKRNQYEQDSEVGRNPRSLYAIVLGLTWGVFSLVSPTLAPKLGLEVNAYTFLAHSIVVVTIAAVPLLLARRALMQNTANRNFIYSLFMILIAGMVCRFVGVLVDLPITVIPAFELVAYGGACLVLSQFFDRTLVLMTAASWAGAVLIAIFPDYLFSIFGSSVVVGTFALAAAWWNRDPCERVGG